MSELEQARQAREEIDRAELARQVMDNPVYQEAYQMFRGQCMEQFQNTKFKDSAERDEIWRKMQTITYVHDYFEELMDTGKFGQQTLTNLERVKKLIPGL